MELRINRVRIKRSRPVKLSKCVLFVLTDDWETITERIVEADCWMGEFGKAGWFLGYLAVHVHRPSSRWSRMKLLGRFAVRSEKAVSKQSIKDTKYS